MDSAEHLADLGFRVKAVVQGVVGVVLGKLGDLGILQSLKGGAEDLVEVYLHQYFYYGSNPVNNK